MLESVASIENYGFIVYSIFVRFIQMQETQMQKAFPAFSLGLNQLVKELILCQLRSI